MFPRQNMRIVAEVRQMKTHPLIIDLGCGENKYPYAIGMDNVKLDVVDVVHDLLDFPYPFETGKTDLAVLSHVIEHFEIEQIVKILTEVHRILNDRGMLLISIPHAGSIGAFVDITHKTFFTFNSIRFLTPEHNKSYYKAIPASWQLMETWSSVVLLNDTLKPLSYFWQKASGACSRILNFVIRHSKTQTGPDLMVKIFPFWIVNIHCTLKKRNGS